MMNQLYIDGTWTAGSGGRTWTVTNPATGEHLADVAVAAAEDVDRAVRAARRAFDEGPWPRLDPLERGRMLYQLAARIRTQLDELAMTDTRNIGKPIRDTRGFDVPCAADLFESYAGLPDKIAGKCYGTLPDNVTMQFREPMGAIAAIVPWNFPLTNAAIKLAPILACGNTVVLKPSEVSPLSALMLAKLTQEVGFPPGVVNVIHGTGAETGAALVRHPGIDKITFTGRHQTGIQMLEAAKIGMKGVMLELGGKTPSVVFPDAPLDQVVNGVITGIFYQPRSSLRRRLAAAGPREPARRSAGTHHRQSEEAPAGRPDRSEQSSRVPRHAAALCQRATIRRAGSARRGQLRAVGPAPRGSAELLLSAHDL